jgi:hypothetical protein
MKRRLQFARDNNCNNVVLTGSGEPVCNRNFFKRFAKMNEELRTPFQWIELQTSGILLTTTEQGQEILALLRGAGVSTISLSLANLFDSELNAELMNTPKKLRFNIAELCQAIKDHGFNLRLSLNMSDVYNEVLPATIFDTAQVLGANQLTFRKLYASEKDSEQAEWVKKHQWNPKEVAVRSSPTPLYTNGMDHYILTHGRELEKLPFGATRYSIHGMSVVVDDDCMNVKSKETLRYLILRENGKLYTKWDDEGSLLF